MIGGAFLVAPLGGLATAVLIAAGMFILWFSNALFGMRSIGIDRRPLLLTTARVVGVFAACSGAAVLVDVTVMAAHAAPLGLAVGVAVWVSMFVLIAVLFRAVRRDVLTVVRFAGIGATRRRGSGSARGGTLGP